MDDDIYQMCSKNPDHQNL